MYPAADDYSFGSRCKFVWDAGHSLAETVIQAGKAVVYYYENWAGCFTSSFFMVLQPAVFGNFFYKLTPVFMICILSFGTLFFLRILLVRLLKWDFWSVLGIAAMYLFVVVQCAVSPLEAYFWYNGAAHYTLLHSLSLFLYGIMLCMAMEENRRKKVICLILACALAFAVGGGNYLTALNAAILFAAAIAGFIFTGKVRKYFSLFLPMGIFYLAFLLNVTAPGNAVRASVSSGMGPIKAIVLSFYYAYEYCITEWTGWMVLAGGVMTAVFCWYAVKDTRFKFPRPLAAVVVAFCLTAAMITPCLYGTGNIEAGRIKSLIFTMYVLLLYVSIGYVVGWMKIKHMERAGKEEELSISSNALWTMAGCLLFLVAGYGIVSLAEPGSFTSTEAFRELRSGEARMYAEVMEQRIELYTSGERNVVVPQVPVRPPLLFFSDINTDPADWENQSVCRFFGLESVRLEE